MTSVIDKIQKRRFYPVKIENGETLHVRSLRWSEKYVLPTLPTPEDQIVYSLGCCLVEENGERSFQIGDTESPAEFVARIKPLASELTYEDVKALADAIKKVTDTPSVETVVKNSEATGAPAS